MEGQRKLFIKKLKKNEIQIKTKEKANKYLECSSSFGRFKKTNKKITTDK